MAPNCGDKNKEYDIAAFAAENKLGMSSVSHSCVASVNVPWGKLTKTIVVNVFKDVDTGFGPAFTYLHEPFCDSSSSSFSVPCVWRAQSCRGNTGHGKTGYLEEIH